MTWLEWGLYAGIVLSAICILSFLFSILMKLLLRQDIKKIERNRAKLRKKKRKQQEVRKLNKELQTKSAIGNRYTLLLFISFILLLLFSGATAYGRYYQSMNLSSNDKELLIKSASYLKNFEEQITKADTEAADKQKIEQNVRTLANNLASYGTRSANSLNSEEGQIVLNRYYRAITQLGINASSQANKFYHNKEMISDFEKDIKTAKRYQKEVFIYYKINQQ